MVGIQSVRETNKVPRSRGSVKFLRIPNGSVLFMTPGNCTIGHYPIDNICPFLPLAALADPSSFTAGEKLLASLCFVYCSWILSLAYRVWWSESGRNVFRGSGRVIFSLVASSLTLLIVVPSIILESFSPRVQGEYDDRTWYCFLELIVSLTRPRSFVVAVFVTCFFIRRSRTMRESNRMGRMGRARRTALLL